MVGTAGFEPATNGFLQTTTEAVAHYSPLLCQIELRPGQPVASLVVIKGLLSSATAIGLRET